MASDVFLASQVAGIVYLVYRFTDPLNRARLYR